MDVLLANPRGFCAGVDRAIAIVLQALEKFGAPIYVRHEVVHNKFVVDDLRARGAIFVEELSEVPAGSTVVFSAHGVAKGVRAEADARGLRVFDATCPLVTKVHVEIAKMHERGLEIVMIGHRGHPEVEGTMGQCDGGVLPRRDGRRRRAPRRARSWQPRLRHADHAVGRRCSGHRGGAEGALSDHRRSEEGRHLLRDAESAGRGEVPFAARRRDDRRRQPEQLQFQPAARGRRASRHSRLHGRPRGRTPSRVGRGQGTRRHHGRRLGARSAGARGRRSTGSAGRRARAGDRRRDGDRRVSAAQGALPARTASPCPRAADRRGSGALSCVHARGETTAARSRTLRARVPPPCPRPAHAGRFR